MATIQDISKETKLPTATVARILRGGNKEVWPSAIARAQLVRAAADRLGYRPNAAARAVSTGRFNAVGLLHAAGPDRSYSPPALLDGIYAALEEHNLHLTSAKLPDAKLTSSGFVPRILMELAADGLLVDYIRDVPKRLSDLVEHHQIPVIYLNTGRDFDVVNPDDVHVAHLAADHLLELGHRHLAYVCFSTGPHLSTLRRREGVERAVAAAKGRPDSLIRRAQSSSISRRGRSRTAPIEPSIRLTLAAIPTPHDQRVNAARKLLRDFLVPGGPTAVVCYSNGEAEQLMMASAFECVAVPRELSLVTLSEEIVGKFGPTFTTGRIPFREVGERAVEALLKKIESPAHPLPPILVEGDLVAGGTTGPPRDGS